MSLVVTVQITNLRLLLRKEHLLQIRVKDCNQTKFLHCPTQETSRMIKSLMKKELLLSAVLAQQA